MRGLYDCLEVLLRIALVVLLYMSNASSGSPRPIVRDPCRLVLAFCAGPARGGGVGGARTAGNPGMKNSEDAPRDRLKERRKAEAWPDDPAETLYPVFRAPVWIVTSHGSTRRAGRERGRLRGLPREAEVRLKPRLSLRSPGSKREDRPSPDPGP